MDEESRKKSALFVSASSSFLTPFMGSSISVALPSLAREFGMDAILLTWVSTGYLLASAIFLVPVGKLADICGRKKVFQIGVSMFVLSSILAVLCRSSFPIIMIRVLQGIASAMIFGTGIAILVSIYPPKERGKVLGINAASVYLGLSLGPFVGGFLTQHLGWRSIFISIVPLGLLTVYFAFWRLKGEWREARGEKLDLFGCLLYGTGLLSLLYGVSVLPRGRAIYLILAGTATMAIFVRWETKAANPVLNIHLFEANRVFAFSNLAALINCIATFASGFLLSLYLQYTKGLQPGDAGIILATQPVVMALLSPFAGKLSDRIDPRIVASTGMSVTVIGLSLLASIREKTSIGYIVGCLLLLGVGFAFFASPNTNAAMGAVGRKNYGVAAAVLSTMRVTGNMLSMGIVTLLFSVYIGRVQITPEYFPLFLKSLKLAFFTFSLLCFGGVFASLARGSRNLEKGGNVENKD